MSNTITVTTKCDRCGRVIEERELQAPNVAVEDVGEPMLTARLVEVPPVTFAELCAKCQARCATLLEALRVGGKKRGGAA